MQTFLTTRVLAYVRTPVKKHRVEKNVLFMTALRSFVLWSTLIRIRAAEGRVQVFKAHSHYTRKTNKYFQYNKQGTIKCKIIYLKTHKQVRSRKTNVNDCLNPHTHGKKSKACTHSNKIARSAVIMISPPLSELLRLL